MREGERKEGGREGQKRVEKIERKRDRHSGCKIVILKNGENREEKTEEKKRNRQ